MAGSGSECDRCRLVLDACAVRPADGAIAKPKGLHDLRVHAGCGRPPRLAGAGWPGCTHSLALRPRALAAACHLTTRQGRISEAQALLDEGLVLSHQSGAEIVEALCWHMVGNIARVRGALHEAEEDCRRSAILERSHPEAWVGWASNMGGARTLRGR